MRESDANEPCHGIEGWQLPCLSILQPRPHFRGASTCVLILRQSAQCCLECAGRVARANDQMAQRTYVRSVGLLAGQVWMGEGSIATRSIYGFSIIEARRPDAQGTAAHQRTVGFRLQIVPACVGRHLNVRGSVAWTAAVHCHARCIAHIERGAGNPALVVARYLLSRIFLRIAQGPRQGQGQFSIICDLTRCETQHSASRQREGVIEVVGSRYAS